MSDFSVIAPASKKQEMMLNQNCDFAILGGAAGSGKSFVLLLYPLRYSTDPHFRGIIFRKTTSEITGQGGLWETAVELYSRAFDGDIKVHKKDLRITFPSGGSVKFSHMERDDDRFRHQGNQYSFIGFDEGTHFNKECITYLQTRLRSAKAKHKLQVVITCNPDPDWEYLEFVKPYLDEEGTPDLSKDGKVRYYIMVNNQFIFADNIEDLQKIYGVGDSSGIKSYTFISGTCTDNPPLLKNSPGYIGELKSKPYVDMMRLLMGNWYVRPSGSQFFEREWLQEIPYISEDDVLFTVRAHDLSAKLKSDLNPSPDYTTSVRMRKMKSGEYVIDDIRRIRCRVGDWEKNILEWADYDPPGTTYIIPQDPGAAGERVARDMARHLAENGLYVKKTKVTNRGKLDRFKPFASVAQNGSVKIVSNCGTDYENGYVNDLEFYYKELEAFTGERKRGESGHDDLVDATSDAFLALASTSTSLSGISRSLIDINKMMNVGNPFNGMRAF